MPSRIRTNKIQCLLCFDIIESTHSHDHRKCQCGACSVDGGKEYLKRVGNPKYIAELSEYE